MLENVGPDIFDRDQNTAKLVRCREVMAALPKMKNIYGGRGALKFAKDTNPKRDFSLLSFSRSDSAPFCQRGAPW